MTGTTTATRTSVYTMTRAQTNHFGMKLGAELRNVFVKTGLMTEEKAVEVRDDICAFLSRGFAKVVKIQLVKGTTIEFELKYTLRPWDGVSEDQLARGYRRPDVTGLSWYVSITTTPEFESLTATEKEAFYASVGNRWGRGTSRQYGSGSWGGQRSHVHADAQMTRDVFGDR